MFFTQEARLILEEAGVILFKDASANKGGVTSSSLEVLAGLAFTEKEFIENMQVKNDGKDIPAFYSAYVTEVQERIAENARLEFNCIWNEMQANKSKSSILTDQLSDKINSLNDYIQVKKKKKIAPISILLNLFQKLRNPQCGRKKVFAERFCKRHYLKLY